MQNIISLVDLAMPQSCAGCGARLDLVNSRSTQVCLRCAIALQSHPHHVHLKGIGQSEFPIMATALYEGSTRNILLAAKERNQVALIPIIAKAGLIAITSLLTRSDPSVPLALVPVPSMPRNLRSRGYNLVEQMADLIASHLRMRFDDVRVIPILRHNRRVDDQSRLTAIQRALNLGGALTAVDAFLPAMEDRQVIILDDLVTTGSTLLEARRSLLKTGLNLQGAACAMSRY